MFGNDHPGVNQDFIENIFIEIESRPLNTTKNVIIGLIYRVPDSNADLFNKELLDILQKITKENKFIYIMGGYNLDLLKGAMGFGTFKPIDFNKNWYVKVPVVPRSLVL